MKKTLLYKLLLVTTLVYFTPNKIFSQTSELLPDIINLPETNIMYPYISLDGNSILFIIKLEDKDILAESKKDIQGNWQKPIYIDVVNDFDSTDFYIESPSYNHNTSELYFALRHDHKDSIFNIYKSRKVDNKWTKPTKLPSPINSTQNESDPCISPDGKTFYFVRDYKNENLKKVDCKAMYVSHLIDGSWSNPAKLPEPVNSGCDRFPRIAADGKSLFFTSIRSTSTESADIYYTKLITKNAWITPIIVSNLSTELDEITPSINVSGTTIYYSKPTGKKKNDIWKIYKTQNLGEFKPEKTTIFTGVITDLNTSMPLNAQIKIIDPYSSIILFSTSNNSHTGEYSFILQKGRKYIIDVYKKGYSHHFFEYDNTNSTKKEIEKDIKLYKKVNLILNVFDNEIYEPLEGNISVIDKNTGEKQDIIITKIDKGRYSVTLDIGKYYNIEVEKKYFEKNNFELDLTGVVQFSEFEKDIELQIGKVDYEILLTDNKTGEGIQGTVEITNLTSGEKTVITATTDENGRVVIQLRDGNRYEINVSPNGYSFANTVVDLVNEKRKRKTAMPLTPLTEETKIELNDIIFEFNSADLNESSYIELDRVVKLMTNNPQIKIEISAHTDDVGSQNYNLKLSNKRAASVVEYLIDKNVDNTKLISKGYGKSSPKYFPVETEENRAKNRRVELKILEVQQ